MAMGKVTRAEWRWAAIFAGIVMALLTLPYLIAYSSQGRGSRFSGFLFGVEDGNSYIADMRQGADGAWLFRDPYTSEAQSGTPIYLPYLLLGKLAGGAGMHDQLTVLFHLAQIAAGIAMLLAVYRFLACFLESVPLRRWGMAAVGFGGGFGWLLALRGTYPLEFTSPEAFGFLSLFGIPHLAAARALLMLALAWFLSPLPDGGAKRQGVKIGAALVGVWLFQPLTVLVGWAVMGAYLALVFLRNRLGRAVAPGSLREPLTRALIAAGVSLPPVAFTALSFAIDPVLRQWGAQNILPASPLGEYLLSYSVLLLPALAGAYLALRADDRWMLPIGWALIFPVMIYLPISPQRRLAEGFWIVPVVLALYFVEKKLAGQARRAALALAMALMLPAAVIFVSWAGSNSRTPAAPAFLPVEEVRAFEWIDANARPGAIVLAGYNAGNALPAYADVISFIGHGPETLNSAQKMILVQTVFDDTRPDAERLAALRQTGARFALVGPEERARMGSGIPGCRAVYRDGGWEVWEIIRTD
jgi:hypothetical protein